MKKETVRFQGRAYIRYLDAKNPSDRRYFKGGSRILHRDVWEYHNGPIPDGHHIHHKDHDTSNNDISNLELVPAGRHHKYHGETNTWPRSEAGRDHLEAIRPLTKAWHASPEGLEWHRQHGVEAFKKRTPTERTCQQCGVTYTTLQRGDRTRFCSNNCKSAWRRDSGVDDVTKVCVYCGKSFVANKYAIAKCCSNQCASKLRRA